MADLKLFMLLLGCTPSGRHTEQHDVFFSIAHALKDLVPEIVQFWPEAKGNIHIDAWREVTQVDGFRIIIMEGLRNADQSDTAQTKIFFLNLGGYKKEEFEEYHYKMLATGRNKGEAIIKAKQTAFYKHTGFTGAESHIDDKYGVDVDDVYQIDDILPATVKQKYRIMLSPGDPGAVDEVHLGYFQLHKL